MTEYINAQPPIVTTLAFTPEEARDRRDHALSLLGLTLDQWRAYVHDRPDGWKRLSWAATVKSMAYLLEEGE